MRLRLSFVAFVVVLVASAIPAEAQLFGSVIAFDGNFDNGGQSGLPRFTGWYPVTSQMVNFTPECKPGHPRPELCRRGLLLVQFIGIQTNPSYMVAAVVMHPSRSGAIGSVARPGACVEGWGTSSGAARLPNPDFWIVGDLNNDGIDDLWTARDENRLPMEIFIGKGLAACR